MEVERFAGGVMGPGRIPTLAKNARVGQPQRGSGGRKGGSARPGNLRVENSKWNASSGRAAQWFLREGEMKRHYATKEADAVGRILLQHQVTICDSAPRLSG
jgi:hypothetical protein